MPFYLYRLNFLCFFSQGLGTDESVLIEILLTRTNAQIEEMKSVYGCKSDFFPGITINIEQ